MRQKAGRLMAFDQRQIEQRGEHRKCLDAHIRLSCQTPRVRACSTVEHPGWHFKPSIGLRRFQRAAEDDKIILVAGAIASNGNFEVFDDTSSNTLYDHGDNCIDGNELTFPIIPITRYLPAAVRLRL